MKIRLKKSGCERLIKAIDAYLEKKDEELGDALDDAGYHDPKGTVKKIEQMEKEVRKLLNQDTEEILGALEEYDSIEDFFVNKWPELKGQTEMIEKLTKTFTQELGGVMPSLVSAYVKRTDPALNYLGLTHRTEDWIKSWSAELARNMKLSDNNVIEGILQRALRDGKSVAETARKISDSGIRDAGYRARRVATTEMLRAHNVAQQESFMQSPAVVHKMWRHSGLRQYSRQNHIDMDGQTVRKEEPFMLFAEEGGVYYPMMPMDPCLPAGETINCGCISQPIVDQSIYELTEEDRQRMQQAEINRMNAEYEWEHRNDPKYTEQESGKGRNPDTRINNERYRDKELRRRINSLGEDEKTSKAMYRAARSALKHRDGTFFEDLAYVDSNSGKWKINKDYDYYDAEKRVSQCMPSKAMNKMYENSEKKSIISLHNHPRSGCPSIGDLGKSADRGDKYGMVFCHDGTIFKYEVDKDFDDFNANMVLARMDNMLYTGNERKFQQCLDDLKSFGVRMEIIP